MRITLKKAVAAQFSFGAPGLSQRLGTARFLNSGEGSTAQFQYNGSRAAEIIRKKSYTYVLVRILLFAVNRKKIPVRRRSTKTIGRTARLFSYAGGLSAKKRPSFASNRNDLESFNNGPGAIRRFEPKEGADAGGLDRRRSG